MIFTLVVVILCILLEAFFAGSELAVVSVNRTHLRYLVEKGSSKAKALHEALKNPEWLLSTTLLGTNLSTITVNTVVTLFIINTWGQKYEFLTIVFTWPIVLVFAEALPKAIAYRFANSLAFHLVYPLRVFSWLMSPMVYSVAWVAKATLILFGVKTTKKTPFMTREELELVLQASERSGAVKHYEQKMIDRVFSFSDLQARDVMIALIDVMSIPLEMTLDQAAHVIKRSGYSRLPVYSGRIDNIVGWVGHYDVLLAKDRQSVVSNILRDVRFVPTTASVGKLLITMQRRGDSLVMLVDEYGGVVGMITLEDIIEEIVGNIEDEYDSENIFVKRVGKHFIHVVARVPLEQLSEFVTTHLPEGPYETLAGFLLTKMQRIPEAGEVFVYGNMTFTIKRVSDRSIEEVLINF